MDLKNIIENAVLKSSKNKKFKICDLKIDDKNFGNVFLLLELNEKIQIKFVKDRVDQWCELGDFHEWFPIENVFEKIKIDEEIKTTDFIFLITGILDLVDKNFEKILLEIKGYTFEKEDDLWKAVPKDQK